MSSRRRPVSAPPASPSVTMQYATSMPASVNVPTIPANPKSTSSGCAVTTSTRSTPSRSSASMVREASSISTAPFPARELVGMLADDDRRRVFAALILGAVHADEVRAQPGLDARAAGRALQRLVDAGLVI